MEILDWVMRYGSPVDAVIVALGVPVVVYVGYIQRRQIEKLNNEITELTRLYNQVDKLTYGIAIVLKLKKRVSVMKQSANGVGDHALDRDVT